MMAKLYIVEGLPCSGKSTTAGFIAECLRQDGSNVCLVDEGTGDHPADYEWHAFVNGQVISLADVPQEELPGLLPCKIYDGLPWETEFPLMLDKWQSFVESANDSTTYVFNCVLLQNPMCETMMRFGMREEASADYIRRIAEIIRPLDPVVIYLHTDDAQQMIRRTASERPGWLEAVIDYHVSGGYGRSIGAAGFDGYIACLEERQRREERILSSLPVTARILRNAHRDWSAARAELEKMI